MIYINGKIVSIEQAALAHNDRGILLGDGLFETMRVYEGNIFCVEDHYARLIAGTKILKIPLLLTFNELNEILINLLQVNDLLNKDATIRITITRGAGPRGLLPPADPKPSIMITVFPFSATAHPPISLYVSYLTRRNEKSPLSNIKSLGYLDNVLAKMDAIENNYDDAILLNTQDMVSCVTAGNIFIVTLNNEVITPRIEDGILPGITRKMIIEICKKNNIPVLEKTITVDELLRSQEVFVTNSIIEIQPVSKINNQLINRGEVGKITSKIQSYYHEKTKYLISHPISSLSYQNSLKVTANFSGSKKEKISQEKPEEGLQKSKIP